MVGGRDLGLGAQQHPPDTDDFELDFEYLSWKYGGVLATTGGEFTSVTISMDPQVVCPRFPFDPNPPVGYACTGGASVVFGTNTFRGSDNQTASIIGHELVHTVDDPFAGECPAYQWEEDHSQETGISFCDTDYLDEVRDQLQDRQCP